MRAMSIFFENRRLSMINILKEGKVEGDSDVNDRGAFRLHPFPERLSTSRESIGYASEEHESARWVNQQKSDKECLIESFGALITWCLPDSFLKDKNRILL